MKTGKFKSPNSFSKITILLSVFSTSDLINLVFPEPKNPDTSIIFIKTPPRNSGKANQLFRYYFYSSSKITIGLIKSAGLSFINNNASSTLSNPWNLCVNK